MDINAKIVNFEKMDKKNWEIYEETLHIPYGEVKMASTKLGFTTPSC